jgi:D-3-phosphoglycerate dehydrogenase / 2-oxoglutarate reductase
LTTLVACLSPFDEQTVKSMFGDRVETEVLIVPAGASESQIGTACMDVDLVIGDRRHKLQITRSVIEKMKRCKLIQQPAAGFESIDHRAAADRGIPVANAGGFNKGAVADWTVMAMIALLRHSFEGDRAIRSGLWQADGSMRALMMGHELGAMTVGIVGMGNVGSAVAERLAGFGCRVLYTDITDRAAPGAERVSLDSLLGESDIVTVHVPLDRDTRALIGRETLRTMKAGSYLINASRGPVLDERALIDALQSGHLSGAALDVFEIEPLPNDSPLLKLENVVLAPHAGAATAESEDRLLQVVAANLIRVVDGLPPLHVVNAVGVGLR